MSSANIRSLRVIWGCEHKRATLVWIGLTQADEGDGDARVIPPEGPLLGEPQRHAVRQLWERRLWFLNLNWPVLGHMGRQGVLMAVASKSPL